MESIKINSKTVPILLRDGDYKWVIPKDFKGPVFEFVDDEYKK